MKTSGLLFVGLLAIFILGQSVLQSSRNESLIAASVRAESVRAEQPVQPQVISSSNLESRVAELENRFASTQQNSGSRRLQEPRFPGAPGMAAPEMSFRRSLQPESKPESLAQIDQWRQGRWTFSSSFAPKIARSSTPEAPTREVYKWRQGRWTEDFSSPKAALTKTPATYYK